MFKILSSEIPDYVRMVLDVYETVELDAIFHAVTPMPSVVSPIVISVIRDERVRLSDFLRHYRTLGI